MARSAEELNEALGVTEASTDDTTASTVGTVESTEYYCLIDGCQAHFSAWEQTERHIVEDHSFLEHVRSLIEERDAVVESD